MTSLIEEDLFTTTKLIDDHYITIEHTKFLEIPYFKFGFTTHFYFPYTKIPNKIKLSEIKNPPFTIGPDCKLKYYLLINYLNSKMFYMLLYSFNYFFYRFYYYSFLFHENIYT